MFGRTYGAILAELSVGVLMFLAYSTNGSDTDKPARPIFMSHFNEEGRRLCTADDLLPSLYEEIEDRWVQLGTDETRKEGYNCSCPFMKAR